MFSKRLAFVFFILVGAIVCFIVAFGVMVDGDSAAEHSKSFIDVSANVVFWKIVSFAVLFVGVSFMWEKILAFLDERKDKIKQDLNHAEHERISAEKIFSESKQHMIDALKKRKQILEESRSEAHKIKTQILEEAKAHADTLIEDAKKEIIVKKQQLLEDLKKEIGGLSVLIASKLIRKSLNREEHENFIQQAVVKYQVSSQG